MGFEAGYLKALGRKFILLKDKKTKPPTDLRGLKYAVYSDRNGFLKELSEWLRQNVPEAKEIPEHKEVLKIIGNMKRRSKLSDDQAADVLMILLSNLAHSGGTPID